MKRLPRRRLLPLAAAVAAVAAGCGGSADSGPAETVPAGALEVKAVASLKFDAESYGPVPAGEVTLGYVNEENIRHTLIIAKDDTKVPNFKLVVEDKGSVDVGTVALEAGTYTLICDVPGHGNMRATLTVE